MQKYSVKLDGEKRAVIKDMNKLYDTRRDYENEGTDHILARGLPISVKQRKGCLLRMETRHAATYVTSEQHANGRHLASSRTSTRTVSKL
jgi:N6-adenosine-specific RNA methylase IME4